MLLTLLCTNKTTDCHQFWSIMNDCHSSICSMSSWSTEQTQEEGWIPHPNENMRQWGTCLISKKLPGQGSHFSSHMGTVSVNRLLKNFLYLACCTKVLLNMDPFILFILCLFHNLQYIHIISLQFNYTCDFSTLLKY